MTKKIFIVDDDKTFLTMLEDFLKRDVPHQVFPFISGEECIKNLYADPDVIILDYNLDGVKSGSPNGLEVLKSIKKNNSRAHVIMLSGQESYGVALQTVQKGAVQYVIKDKDAFEKIAALIEGL